MYEDFEKQLTKLLETRIDEITKESKAKSVLEFAKDEVSIAKVNRAHNAKGLLFYLYMEKDLIPGLKLDARIEKYGLAKVFSYVCSNRNLFVEAYDDDDLWTYHIANEFDDLWTYHIANEFDNCLPVS